jgi:hypothetical protein
VCVCVCSCAGKRYSSAPLDARYRCISVPRCFSGEAGCSRTLSCLREERKHAVSKDAMSSLKKLQSSQLLCTLLSLFPTPSHRHHIFTSSQCPLNCLPPLLSPSRSLCLVTHTQRKNLQRSTKRNRSTTGFVHALRFRHPTGVIAGDCPPFPSSSRLARVNDLFFFHLFFSLLVIARRFPKAADHIVFRPQRALVSEVQSLVKDVFFFLLMLAFVFSSPLFLPFSRFLSTAVFSLIRRLHVVDSLHICSFFLFAW